MTKAQLTAEEVHALAFDSLTEAGASAAHANAIAANMTAAERNGSASHGLFRLPGHIRMLQDGRAKGAPSPALEQIAPAVLRLKADNAFIPYALEICRPGLIELARKTGIATLAVTKAHHFSALWADTEPFAEAGLAAIACTAYVPVVAPAGAKVPFFGTNPLSFAWPRGDGDPMVFDMATAEMARGEIQIAARENESVPHSAGINAAGDPTSDPNEILNGGAQLPFGGYKGSAIALMVEMLAAGLIGAAFSDEAGKTVGADGGPPEAGVLIIAIDPNHFGNAEGWKAHSDAFLGRFEALPGDPTLPGARRAARRARIAAEGIQIPQSLLNEIAQLRTG